MLLTPCLLVACCVQVDAGVAYHLWVLVFPIVWATLAKQQQINLAKPIISMLSKEFHQRQAMMRPNVVQVSGSNRTDRTCIHLWVHVWSCVLSAD